MSTAPLLPRLALQPPGPQVKCKPLKGSHPPFRCAVPTFNNRPDIAQNKVRTQLKAIYYELFAALYGLMGFWCEVCAPPSAGPTPLNESDAESPLCLLSLVRHLSINMVPETCQAVEVGVASGEQEPIIRSMRWIVRRSSRGHRW